MPDLQIVISADASDLISKLDAAAEQIRSASTQISSSLSGASEQASLFGETINESSGQLTGEAAVIQTLRDRLQEAAAAFAEAAAASDALSGRAVGASGGDEEAAAYTEATLREVAALNTLNEVEAQVIETLNLAAEQLRNVGQAAASAGQQYELFADAVNNVTIADVQEPLADATGQFLLFTEAVADATGQLNLFETVSSEEAAAQRSASEAAAQYAVNIDKLKAAVDFLNNSQAVNNASSQEVAAAQHTVATEAERLATAMGRVATSSKAAAVAQNEVGTAAERTGTQLGSAVARMAAEEVGAGRLAYTFGLLARSIPGLSAALEVLFVPILLFTVADIIQSIVDKFTKMEDEVRKVTLAFTDFSAAATNSAESLELQNLKLEDQLAKLEGRPVANRLKEALIESRIEADKLSKALADAAEKAIELLEKADVSIFKSLISGEAATSSVFGAGDKFKDLKEKLGAAAAAYNDYRDAQQSVTLAIQQNDKLGEAAAIGVAEKRKQIANDSLKTARDAVDQAIVQAERERTEAAKPRLLSAGTTLAGGPQYVQESQAEATARANKAYQAQIARLHELSSALKEYTIAEAESEKQPGLRTSVAAQENLNDQLKIQKEQLDTELKLADAKAGTASKDAIAAEQSRVQAGGGTGELSPDKILEVKLAALQKAYDREDAIFAEEAKLYQDNPEKFREVSKAWDDAFQKHLDAVRAAHDEEINSWRDFNKNLKSEFNTMETQVKAALLKKETLVDRAGEKQDRLGGLLVGEIELKALEQQIRVTEQLHSMNRINRTEALNDIKKEIADLEKKAKAAEKYYEIQINQRRALLSDAYKQSGGLIVTPEDAAILAEIEDKQKDLAAISESYASGISSARASWEKLNVSSSHYFTQLNSESNDFFSSFQLGWQQALNSMNTGFADAVDKWISYGNTFRDNFGRNMANLGVKILEQFTNIFLQIGLKQAEVGVAKLFGANIGGAIGPGDAAHNAAQTANTTALTTSTASLTAFTTAVNAATVAQGGQVPAVTASTTAHTAHAVSVWHSTFAHLEHAVAVVASTLAHILHAIWVAIDTAAVQIAAAVKIAFAWIGLAGGGQVPGHGSTDSIPAMLTPGEFVVTKSAASTPGAMEFLGKLNKGEAHVRSGAGIGKAFSHGGIVGPASTSYFAAGGQAGSTFNHTTSTSSDSHDTHSFKVMYAPTFGKDFNVEEHGPMLIDYMKGALRRAGYSV